MACFSVFLPQLFFFFYLLKGLFHLLFSSRVSPESLLVNAEFLLPTSFFLHFFLGFLFICSFFYFFVLNARSLGSRVALLACDV